jgi:FAD/FMN-containing dehydrogenase
LTHDLGMTSLDHNYAKLRDGVTGAVVLRTDDGFDRARSCWNLSVDQRPVAVVEAAGVKDIQAVVRFAAREGLRVAPQATGHGSESLGPLDGALLLKTSRMRAVAVDPDGRVAHVQAGALAGDVAGAAGTHGLAPVLGLSPTVGAAGLALVGGIGWLSRSHGLACNNVRALDVVLASGEARRVNAGSDPDLFWALRGGGGRSAIVTSVELAAHPVAEASGGMLVWPAERARDVLERFGEITADAPEELSLVFRYIAMPDVDPVPPPLRGRKIVTIIAAHLGDQREGARQLEPLRQLGGSLVDTLKAIEPGELVRLAGDPEQPAPARGAGFMLGGLTGEAIDVLGQLIGSDALSPLGMLEIRHLGGALARPPQDHGALGSLSGAYSVFASGAADSASAAAAVDDRLDDVRARLDPWAAGKVLMSSARAGTDPARGFDPDAWTRLRAIEREHDPDGLILSNREP